MLDPNVPPDVAHGLQRQKPRRRRRVLIWNAAHRLGRATLELLHWQGHACTAHVPAGAPMPVSETIEGWRPGAPADVLVMTPRHLTTNTVHRGSPYGPRDEVILALETTAPRRVVLVSSIEVLGPCMGGEDLFEGTPESPEGVLGRVLRETEDIFFERCEDRRIPLVVLRAGHLYDRREPGCLGSVLDALDGVPSNHLLDHWEDRPFQPVHTDDVARAVGLAIHEGNWIYHLTQDVVPTLGDLALELMGAFRAAGRTPKIGHGPPCQTPTRDRVHYRYPSHRASRELGYRQLHTPALDAERIVEAWTRSRLEDESGARPLWIGGRWVALDPAPEVRRRDVQEGVVTLRELETHRRWMLTVGSSGWWACELSKRSANERAWVPLLGACRVPPGGRFESVRARDSAARARLRELFEEFVALRLEESAILFAADRAAQLGLVTVAGQPGVVA